MQSLYIHAVVTVHSFIEFFIVTLAHTQGVIAYKVRTHIASSTGFLHPFLYHTRRANMLLDEQPFSVQAGTASRNLLAPCGATLS